MENNIFFHWNILGFTLIMPLWLSFGYIFFIHLFSDFWAFFLHVSLLNICKIQHVTGFYFINRVSHSLSSSQLSVLIIYYLSRLGICLDLNKMDVIFCIVLVLLLICFLSPLYFFFSFFLTSCWIFFIFSFSFFFVLFKF